MKGIEHREVLVVGAGPGGTSAAQKLAEEDVDVLVIERRNVVGNPTQCGECIPNWGEITEAFHDLESDPWLKQAFVFPDRIQAQRLDWMRIFSPSMKAWGLELDAFSAHRPQFDGHLADRAIDAGAEIRTETQLRKVQRQKRLDREVYITDQGKFTADHIIDASGALAHVARLRRGQDKTVRPPQPIPTVYANVSGEIPESFDIFLGNVAPSGYTWIIPKGETANVGLGLPAGKLGSTMLKSRLDDFCKALDFEILSYGGGWIPIGGQVRKMVDDNVLAVGDAAGLVMPSNGGGIAQAMISGKFAADAIIERNRTGASLDAYPKAVNHCLRKALRISLRSKRLGVALLRNDPMAEVVCRLMGPVGGLRRAIECKPPLWIL